MVLVTGTAAGPSDTFTDRVVGTIRQPQPVIDCLSVLACFINPLILNPTENDSVSDFFAS